MGDDSTRSKPKGRKREGLGKPHWTTENKRIVGQSLVQGLDVLLERRCPLAPQLSRHEAGCASDGVALHSTIDLLETRRRSFEPVAGTVTHSLLESWSCANCLWRGARERDFRITPGLKCTRWLRVADETAQQGWGGPQVSDDVAGLTAQDSVQMPWPRGGQLVYVYVLTPSVRKLSRCQVVLVRQSLDAALTQARLWARSRSAGRPAEAARPDRRTLGQRGARCGWQRARRLGPRATDERHGHGALLDPGDAGLRLRGRGAAPLAAAVATPCLPWPGAPRTPAPSSPLAAALALCAVPIRRST